MFEWLPPDVQVVTDVSVADWFVSVLLPWGQDAVRLTSFMPMSFEAYARVFHPATDGRTRHRWADLGAERGVILSPEVSFDQVMGVEFEVAYTLPVSPECGSLEEDSCRALGAILERHTTTPRTCFFGVFDTGRFETGMLLRSGSKRQRRRAHREDMKVVKAERRQIAAVPLIDVPNRRQVVFHGPIGLRARWRGRDRRRSLRTRGGRRTTYGW
jgi:hypothetical protein